jgi:ATP-dependent Clp protease ATP-binding subunit ClpA
MYEQLPDGTKRPRVTPNMHYNEIAMKISSAIDDFFKFKINRPEILNRIGKNIVVFDFIREDTALLIFDRMMENIMFRLDDSYGIRISFDDRARQRLENLVCSDLSMGGRGIGANLEAYFINPLSRRLCEVHVNGPVTYVVRDLRETSEGYWELEIE